MRLQAFELKMLCIEGLLMALIAGILYLVYWIPYQRMKAIAGI